MDVCGLPKARPIVCNDCRAFQRHHTSVSCAAENPARFRGTINTTFDRQGAAAALGLSTGLDVQGGAALALAIAGDNAQSQRQAEDLSKRFPESTVVQFNYLPTIHAQLDRG